MHSMDSFVFSMCLIFIGAAVLSTLALYLRQSLLVAYILLGALLGPWGLKLVANHEVIRQTGDVGIIFLLFLLGLYLHPQSLWRMLRKTVFVSMASSLIFAIVGYAVALSFQYTQMESLIVGAAMMFSSTIIGLKLMPTNVLQHQHTGEMLVSILLFQDLIAIVVLLLIHGVNTGGASWVSFLFIILALPALLIIAYVVQRFILIKLITHFESFKEYAFLLSIAWCLGMAQLAG